MAFDKDKWVRTALLRGYIKPSVDGTILRAIGASSDGSNISHEYRPIKMQTHNKSGRVYFNMTWLGHTKSVLTNRVIALAFLPNPLNLPQVNHKDGVKANNALSNLEWATRRDNEIHAHRNGLKTGRGSNNANVKLTADEVIEIRQSLLSVPELAEKYRVSRSAIVNVIRRSTWKHI